VSLLKLRTPFAGFIAAALAGTLVAQFNAKSKARAAPFDYYVLSLSWEPGFIVHGLWPEAAAGNSPESCGTAKPVPKAVVAFALMDMPSPSLIQHEWAVHGVCTGLNPFDYFSSIAQARAALQIPVQITSIEEPLRESPGQIETQFAMANTAFPVSAFRTSCPGGEFSEERICFDKTLKPRACTASVGECTVPAVTIRAPAPPSIKSRRK